MSLILIAPLPMSAPLTQHGPDGKDTGYCSTDWYQSLFSMFLRLNNSSQVITQPIPALTGQTGSILATALPVGAVTAGFYRVSWYARITQAATTSSTLTVTIGWTESGVGVTTSGPALTANVVTATQSANVLIKADANSPLTYATTYGSVGGTSMQYSLSVLAEFLGTA